MTGLLDFKVETSLPAYNVVRTEAKKAMFVIISLNKFQMTKIVVIIQLDLFNNRNFTIKQGCSEIVILKFKDRMKPK